LRLAWRAIGWRRALVCHAVSWLPLAAGALILTNNSLPDHLERGVLRFVLGASLILLLSAVAELLVTRRPAWSWARSLPVSARWRVLGDAGVFVLLCSPLLLLAAWYGPGLFGTSVCVVLLFALRAAGSIRRAPERTSGASGEILAEGLFAVAWITLVPWLALLCLLLLPVALDNAAARERAQKTSRWRELHHLEAGDPLAWRAS
jgi:hypothetical protein